MVPEPTYGTTPPPSTGVPFADTTPSFTPYPRHDIHQSPGRNRSVTATHGDSGQLYASLAVPTLQDVNYDTTLGKNMTVYTGVGTAGHNVKEHGGGLTLRSWFGFKKHIAVNCNGMVTEGRNPG